MANEAVLLIETELPIPFTVADGTGIEKGAVLKLADPNTVSAAAADEDVVGGIAAAEKIADDGDVNIAIYRGGIFKVTASGSITAGDALAIDGRTDNLIYSATGLQSISASGSRIIGTSLETATDLQTFKMELRPQVAVQVA